MQLTKNFSLEELVASSTAAKLHINNAPSPEIVQKLDRLAKEILQPIRDAYGKPIAVSSGYRSPALNRAVNGSSTSQHMKGEAADLQCANNAELFNIIRGLMQSGRIVVGQLIWEYGTRQQPRWVHVSLPSTKRNQILQIGVK